MPPRMRCRKPICAPSRKLDSYQPTGKFGAWLTRVALNEALMMRRRERGDTVSLDEVGDDALVSRKRPRPATRQPRISSSKRRMHARCSSTPSMRCRRTSAWCSCCAWSKDSTCARPRSASSSTPPPCARGCSARSASCAASCRGGCRARARRSSTSAPSAAIASWTRARAPAALTTVGMRSLNGRGTQLPRAGGLHPPQCWLGIDRPLPRTTRAPVPRAESPANA